ncbi:DEAD/DEAH box helicase [Polyangium spumosum]|uniref:DEAD/DEAH box helicase n=1 Tax=Polyangium spumosum TaxID=889282 RepID=A0A6N7PET7_9BACT|nr:DEAD/DEAH box helicase [Polyangium spumosum]MRG90573.1 DEAD/DEAH box helicase [Polyangium spumosum]
MTDQNPTSQGANASEARTSDPAATAGQAAATAPTFEVLPLSSELRETLAEIGYMNPTPVQVAVWEPATRGRDAVVQARTGTGKTAAFGLPIVDHLVKRSVAHVQVLALCPTRELALQVTAEIERLGKRKGVRVVPVYGGAPMPRQIDAIAAGAQVIVGTPGRVLDHLRRGTLDPKGIRLLVLDECDEMLSMGFERELSAILERLPENRQTLLFSATLPPDIERMAKSKLKNPEFVTLSGDHVGALSIDHFVYMVAGDKLGALVRVIEVENPESAVIFCNTRDETERVASALQRQGFDADWLSGELAQADRERVMSATREGRLRFLVATDVAARGIDISLLTHVINYDFPQDAESYVHRTGRTGRAGRTGTAISLIAPQDIGGLYLMRLTYKIKPIERQIPTEGELKTRAEADLVNMLAEAFAPKGTHPDDLSLARRILSHDASERILAGLLRDHLGARPTARDEAAAARRTGPAPKRVEEAAPAPAKAEAKAPREPREERPRREREPRVVSEDRPRREEREDRPRREEREERAAGEEREPRERRPRGRREGRPEMPRPVRARAGEEVAPTPVSAAEPLPPPKTRAAAPVRHSDFTSWQPPEEEGDDEPILGDAAHATAREPAREVPREVGLDDTDPGRSQEGSSGDYAEVFVSVGRRDGVRAADLQALLLDQIGLDKADVKRIRVRERNAFVSVRRAELARAVAGLSGATLAGRTVSAEPARERTGAGGEIDADAAGAVEP